ncbi:hypothetical protein APHAL10511_001712 [Amanita phalloides]|nr:hypothetical protein APHAL10511_001712 [Amanita phalloides]
MPDDSKVVKDHNEALGQTGDPNVHLPESQSRDNAQISNKSELDRSQLLERARMFLASPQVIYQDTSTKRKFLEEKGLQDAEIESLLRQTAPLLVPPRTYPQLAPSNIPTLLLGLARLLSWIVGGCAVLLFIYRRFLFPRIAQTLVSRQSLRSHYNALLQKFTSSLSAFKESQAESYSALPHSEPYKEPLSYIDCQTVSEVLKLLDEEPEYHKISPVTILRTGITDLERVNGNGVPPTTEELYRYMEDRIPWLATQDGRVYEQVLWETLNTCPLFSHESDSSTEARADETSAHVRWTYHPLEPPGPTQLEKSLNTLSASLPRTTTQDSKYHRTMQTLSDLTGYISSQLYSPYKPPSGFGGFSGSGSSLLSPAEEELRREIRALKGLVLNRRYFMSTIPRVTPSLQQPVTR